MTMRIARPTPTTLLALLACMACLTCYASKPGSALAASTGPTGGASAGTDTGTSTTSSSQPAAPKVHPTGIATWFGPGFYGHTTACGQTLTPAVVGVANRTLPCGTLVQVSYHDQTLTVPVLDRGPYANHANWDLTAGAAQALGITETVRIATRVVGSAPNTPTLGSPPLTPAEISTGGAQASS
jgi:rare lipoprotein A (peptidoglycan hydrolase)